MATIQHHADVPAGSQIHNQNEYSNNGTGTHYNTTGNQGHGSGLHHNGVSSQYNEKPYHISGSHVPNPDYYRLANPGPLGLISLGLTALVLGFYQAGVGLPGANPLGDVGPHHAIFGLAIFFGGAAQAIAGIMEFRVGNTFGTTVHLSYAAFFLSFAMFLIPSLFLGTGPGGAYENDERAYTTHLGIYLMAWALLTLIFLLASLKTNIVMLVLFGFLTLAFFFLSLASFLHEKRYTSAVRLNRTGGAFTILAGFAALYSGAAGLMRSPHTTVRFPLGDFPPAKRTDKTAV